MYLDEAVELMDKSIKHSGAELNKIRAGKAIPSMLDGIYVQYYGANTPLNQVATVAAPDARTLMVKPFERKLIADIEKAIRDSDLNVNPQNDGETIRIGLPPMTEERRRDLVKNVSREAEAGKVSIRNIRKETNEGLRKLLKDGASEDAVKAAEDRVQKLTDTHTAKLDVMVEANEKEIMTV